MHDCPEISDLIVDYDLTSLERRPVRKSAVLDTLAQHQNHWALRIARAFPATDGVLDPHFVDGALVRSHLELQRLHEEFLMGMRVLEVLEPLVTAVSARYPGRPVRVVDLGCGLGFVVRWLAKYGALPPHVALVGADYNASFTHAARVLAAEEALPCTFVTGNAFRLAEPATIVTSTGVLHHFRGSALTEVFSHQDRAGVLAFLHFDIKPSIFAPIGSWIFHRARMREPVARHDGYLSAVRAHDGASLLAAAREGAPGLRAALFDGHVGALRLVRIMHAIVGVRPDLEDGFVRALGVRRSRLSGFAGVS
jgi:2-polyprenyl-3-methyl-5-hydroxy-6-metoxy-1,4-benzoquinol methylase